MRFHIGDDNIQLPFPLAGRLQHGISLPDAGTIAEKDF